MVYCVKLSFDYFAIHTLFKIVIRLSANNSRVTYVGMVVCMLAIPRSWYVCFSANSGRVTYHDSIPHCRRFFPGTYTSRRRI